MFATNTTTGTMDLGDDKPVNLKEIHQRGFKWIMVLLFLITTLLCLVLVTCLFGTGLLGLFAAFLLAPLMGYRMTQIYRWATHTRRLRRSLEPGVVQCPRCGSLQTDLMDLRQDEEVTQQRLCFRCDHRWAK